MPLAAVRSALPSSTACGAIPKDYCLRAAFNVAVCVVRLKADTTYKATYTRLRTRRKPDTTYDARVPRWMLGAGGNRQEQHTPNSATILPTRGGL
jgi:hypothetical protein